MRGPSRSPDAESPSEPPRARRRRLPSKVPLIVSLLAGLATMIVPTALQRRAMNIRQQIIREVQPAQRTVGRLQRALTGEVAGEFLYAQLPVDTLLRQRQRARALTDSYLARLDAVPGGLGDTLSRDARSLRATLLAWRRDPDALAAGLLTPSLFSQHVLARQAMMAELLVRTDSLRDALDAAVVSRRNIIMRLSRQSMAGNLSLALL